MMILGNGFLEGDWGGALRNGISALIKEDEIHPWPFLPCEFEVKRQSCMNQEIGPHQTPNLYFGFPGLQNCEQ